MNMVNPINRITNDSTPKIDVSNCLLASDKVQDATQPFISVSIPHYKHIAYLEIVLQSIFTQDFDDFEIIVSNDHSPDDSDLVVPIILQNSGRRFRYYSQQQNLGYDANVRFCLAAASGKYVFLLGNDDALATGALRDISKALHQLNFPEVALTNYAVWGSPHKVVQRALTTEILGAGVDTAVRYFRSFSFVSGLIYDCAAAAKYDTDRWDKSIYYQIYLGCCIIASNGRLGTIDVTAVLKDIRVNDQTVPNYETKWKNAPWSFQWRHTGLDSVIRVASDAIIQHIDKKGHSTINRRLVNQILLILHPFWVLEYRRVANWSYAFGVARGHQPSRLTAGLYLSFLDRLYLWLVYLAVTPIALFLPIRLFNMLKHRLAKLVRRYLRR